MTAEPCRSDWAERWRSTVRGPVSAVGMRTQNMFHLWTGSGWTRPRTSAVNIPIYRPVRHRWLRDQPRSVRSVNQAVETFSCHSRFIESMLVNSRFLIVRGNDAGLPLFNGLLGRRGPALIYMDRDVGGRVEPGGARRRYFRRRPWHVPWICANKSWIYILKYRIHLSERRLRANATAGGRHAGVTR